MKRVVLIDNNDSFTYNIVDAIGKFDIVKLNVIKYDDVVLDDLEEFDKIIISPGPSLPKDYPVLFDVLKRYVEKKPILGICLGHQTICSHFGASLYNLEKVVHGQSHLVNVVNEGLFRDVKSPTIVGLYHSWAVEIDSLPDVIIPTAISDRGVLMGVRHCVFPLFGIQFHPESFLTLEGGKMLYNFINIKNV